MGGGGTTVLRIFSPNTICAHNIRKLDNTEDVKEEPPPPSDSSIISFESLLSIHIVHLIEIITVCTILYSPFEFIVVM